MSGYISFFIHFRTLAERLSDAKYQEAAWVRNGHYTHEMEDDLEDFDVMFGNNYQAEPPEDLFVRWTREFGEDVMLAAILVAARLFTLFRDKLADTEDIPKLLASLEMTHVREAARALALALDKRIGEFGPDLPAPATPKVRVGEG